MRYFRRRLALDILKAGADGLGLPGCARPASLR
jgi:hypothetical protein